MPFLRRPLKVSALFAIGLLSQPCFSEPLDEAISVEQATQQAAAESQQKIDTLNQQTGTLLEQYRFATRQAENLQVENKHYQKVLKHQQLEKASLEQQLKDIAVTQSEIMPLILRMQTNLEEFVEMDLPFLPKERQQRLTKLKSMMLRADVTKAEKFRRIIEAYQIENEYGNTIEAYKDEIDLNGTKSPVDFLRLGRVALYYQRLDGSESGFWNKAEKRWQTLPDSYRNSIRNGLRIARKETAPDLLVLPIPAAEEGK
ncbi:MAG: DUF3450 family protein [Methylococcaceae bacterium]|nr:DUF3450 family protein [Methylococcaceae bacterium]